MAYAAVTSLMSTLRLLMQSNPLLNLYQNKELIESLHKEVKEQSQSLYTKVGTLQVQLETSEMNVNDREEVDRCEGKIRVAAEEVEDRIESVWGKFYDGTENEKVLQELSKSLLQACESIDSKSIELKENMKKSCLEATSSLVQSYDLPEHSPQIDSNMVGHENELKAMKTTLMETPSNENEVVAIVGMGGIGKTTLARRIYDDPSIRPHFDILAWATMSKEYSIRKMVLQLLHCIPSTEDVSCEEMDDGELAAELKRRLFEGRFLVVVDDIWSTDAWDDIRQWFPDNKGSHVLLTTRCRDVATYAAPGKPPHQLSALSREKSWELLQSKVLDKVQLSPELLEIGKKIAENCYGVPLTIIAVAGLLSKCNNALDGWQQIAQDVKWAVFEDPGQQCEKVLALSYYYLPQQLKACFLYFGIFPEDDEVHVKSLINLWVAEGFLKEADNKSLEDVAEECLHELIDRNLVLVSGYNLRGRVKTCKIHDLFHELCLRKAQSQNFLSVINNEPSNELGPMECRRMIVRSVVGFERINSYQYDQKKVRTIVSQAERIEFNRETKREAVSFMNYKMIRVLSWSKICLSQDFPTSLFDLVHLKYLHFVFRRQESFPLCSLQNLQVLIIEMEKYLYCDGKIEIWKMPQLRYLKLVTAPFIYPPTVYSTNHVKLEHLHTIKGVGPKWCRSEIFARMPNLKKFVIVLEHFTTSSLFKSDRGLWEGITCWPSRIEALKVITGRSYYPRFLANPIRYATTLRKLTLVGLQLSWKHMEIVGELPNLETLKLRECNCPVEVWEPASGGFCRLKFLLLDRLNFTEWKASEDHFPVLERLSICCCRWLKEIPLEFANILTLQMIEIYACSDELVTSVKQIQEEQEAIFGGQVTNVCISRTYKGKYSNLAFWIRGC